MQYLCGGDVARALAVTDEEVRQALEVGELAPQDKMDQRMLELVMAARHRAGVVVDGYPRYFEQVVDLLVECERSDYRRLAFVVLSCAPRVSVERLKARARPDDTDGPVMQRMRHWQEEGVRLVSYLDRRRYNMIRLESTNQGIATLSTQVRERLNYWNMC